MNNINTKEKEYNRENEIPDLKDPSNNYEDFSNSVDEYESPDLGGFNEMSEPC